MFWGPNLKVTFRLDVFLQVVTGVEKYEHTRLHYSFLILDTWTVENLCKKI